MKNKFIEALRFFILTDTDFNKLYTDCDITVSYESIVNYVVKEVVENIENYTLDKQYLDISNMVLGKTIINLDEVDSAFKCRLGEVVELLEEKQDLEQEMMDTYSEEFAHIDKFEDIDLEDDHEWAINDIEMFIEEFETEIKRLKQINEELTFS